MPLESIRDDPNSESSSEPQPESIAHGRTQTESMSRDRSEAASSIAPASTGSKEAAKPVAKSSVLQRAASLSALIQPGGANPFAPGSHKSQGPTSAAPSAPGKKN